MHSPATIGLMGGSFNPVHIGHLMVADYIRQHCALERVLLCMSPRNPLKANCGTIADNHRMEMLKIACAPYPGLEACDIEMSMPTPSYTIDTLNKLHEIYPSRNIKLIIGSDNWLIFDKWRAHDEILTNYGVIIYPRPGYDIEQPLPDGASLVNAPGIELSSTILRDEIKKGFNMNLFLPSGVAQYISHNNLYQ